jgi:predicted NUDIX family phosphoesterase
MTRFVMCVHKDDTGFNWRNDQWTCWLPKDDAEQNTRFRQVIPYCAIRRNTGEFLVYERAGGEDRLHGLLSFGVGGHIEEGETIIEGMDRELIEEVDIVGTQVMEYLGKIEMYGNVVELVHIGLAFVIDCVDALPREELKNPRWMFINEIEDSLDEFENWSKVLHKYISSGF